MKRILILLSAALALSACATAQGAQLSPPPSVLTDPGSVLPAPSTIANRTKVDEQAGLAVTLSYVAAAKLATLAIRTGVVSDPATIKRIATANARAKAAVDAVRSAYLAANATGYVAALANARAAVSGLLEAVKGA